MTELDLLKVHCFNFKINANGRVYEPLRCQSAMLSIYHKVTKRTDPRKPAASNGLYTLLALVYFPVKYPNKNPSGIYNFLLLLFTLKYSL
jgi:hypothetical protein